MLASAIEVVYEVMVFGRLYPFEVLLVAFLLACVPYLVVRGLVTRVVVALRRGVHS
jgi:Ca2+/Na+ antiporter